MQRPLLTISLVLLLQPGCQAPLTQDSADSSEEPVLPLGALKGRECDPWTGRWLADGEVYTYLYDEHNKIVDCRFSYTDRNGFWLLDELPSGTWYDIYIQKSYYHIMHRVARLDGEETVDLTDNSDETCGDSRGQVYDP